jgi:hypothetical protein
VPVPALAAVLRRNSSLRFSLKPRW